MNRNLMYIIQCFILSALLASIGRLQRANETLQKLLAETHVQMEVRMLIYQIKRWGWIDYDYFNEVYTGFVEKKRQSLLQDINMIKSQFMECLREHQEAGLLNEGLPAETQMELAVLETCYAYLKKDNAYQQKAFKLFLKKKMEEMAEKGADYGKIEAYLENKHRNSIYRGYMKCISAPMTIELLELWVEFFRSGTGYMDVLPKEWPNVAYSSADIDIPCFIFEEPYVREYTRLEFDARFVAEWDGPHYNPHYDDDCDDPTYYTDYYGELADRPQNAYCYYLCAVSRFKQIQQRLKGNADKGNKKRRNNNGSDI